LTKEKEVGKKVEITIPGGVIDGFCFPFSYKLLQKLKALVTEEGVFKESLGIALNKEQRCVTTDITQIAYCVINHLSDQIQYRTDIAGGRATLPSDVTLLIETAEEFLAIFEKK
jgi:hypothetical protein